MKVSQREARRLQQRVRQLEAEREASFKMWLGDMPSWTAVGRCTVPYTINTAVRVARMLKHPIVAVQSGDSEIVFYACKIGGTE